MAAAAVQSNQVWATGGSTSITVAYPSNVTNGSYLIAAVVWAGASVTCTVKSTETDAAWTALGSPQTGSGALAGYRMQLFRLKNAPAGATTPLATFSTASSFRQLAIAEFSGCDSSSTPEDGSAVYGTPNGAGVTTPTLATSVADVVLFGAVAAEVAISGVAGGFTAQATAATWNGNGTEYKIVSSTGTYGPNFTEGSVQDNIVGFVAIKAATNAHAGYGVAGAVGGGISASVTAETGAGIAGAAGSGFRPGTPVLAPPAANATAASSIADILSVAITAAACAATGSSVAPVVATGLTPANVVAVAANASGLTGTYAIDVAVTAVAAGATASAAPPTFASITIFPPAGTATGSAVAPAISFTSAAPPAAATFHLVVEAAFNAAPDALSPDWTMIANTNRNEFVPGNYPAAVLADNPRGYWRLNETSGNFADSSGNSHTAVAHGGITYSEPGAVGTAITLDGTSGYLSVADHADFDLGDTLTLEIWLKPAAYGAFMIPFDKGNGAYRLSIATAGKFRLEKPGVATVIAASTIPIPLDGAEHHIVASKNGANVHLYLDAIDVTGTVNNQTLTDNAIQLGIGAQLDGAPAAKFLNGTVDEAAIYPTALTADQVRTHYDARASIPPAYVRMMTWRRGRNMPLEQIETGTGGLVLRDADRRWDSKKYADIRPMLPIRAYAVTAAGKTIPIFSHYADGFPRRRNGRDYAEVSVNTVDGMETLAAARVPPSTATVSTNFSALNSNLTFTAREAGPAGNDISVTITETKFHPLRQQRIVVSVAGPKIMVDYIDFTQGAATPVEASEIKAAIEEVPAATALIEVTYPPGNDGSGTVAHVNFPETHLAGGDIALLPAELGGDRISRLADLAKWPVNKRKISPGRDLHGEFPFPTTEPKILSHMQEVVSVASENGLLFVDGDRFLVFRDRLEKLTAPHNFPQLTLSDRPLTGTGGYGHGPYGGHSYGVGGGTREYKYVDLTPHFGKDQIINDATGSRTGGDIQTAFDSESAQVYLRRSSSFSSTLATDGQVKAAVEAVVVEYAQPQERIEQVTVIPGRDWDMWEAILELDVGSLITIKEHPVNGDPVESADYIIQGLVGDVPDDWYATRVTFQVWPAAPISNWLIFDDPIRGVFDAGNRWGR